VKTLESLVQVTTNLLIKSDSQYVVHVTNSVKNWNRHTINKLEHRDLLFRLRTALIKRDTKGSTTKIIWVKSHNGEYGNEAADALANEARSSPIIPDITIPPECTCIVLSNGTIITSRIKQAIATLLAERRRTNFAGTSTGRCLTAKVDKVATLSFFKNTRISSADKSMARRIRFGTAPCQATLAKVAPNVDPKCKTCQVDETLEHILLHCRRFAKHRRALQSKVSKILTNATKRVSHPYWFISPKPAPSHKVEEELLDIDPELGARGIPPLGLPNYIIQSGGSKKSVKPTTSKIIKAITLAAIDIVRSNVRYNIEPP
jgi:hypothetical protein